MQPRASGIARAAARELRLAEAALKDHKKICLPCSRAGKEEAGACVPGKNLASYAALMRKQSALLRSPPNTELIQDTLF